MTVLKCGQIGLRSISRSNVGHGITPYNVTLVSLRWRGADVAARAAEKLHKSCRFMKQIMIKRKRAVNAAVQPKTAAAVRTKATKLITSRLIM